MSTQLSAARVLEQQTKGLANDIQDTLDIIDTNEYIGAHDLFVRFKEVSQLAIPGNTVNLLEVLHALQRIYNYSRDQFSYFRAQDSTQNFKNAIDHSWFEFISLEFINILLNFNLYKEASEVALAMIGNSFVLNKDMSNLDAEVSESLDERTREFDLPLKFAQRRLDHFHDALNMMLPRLIELDLYEYIIELIERCVLNELRPKTIELLAEYAQVKGNKELLDNMKAKVDAELRSFEELCSSFINECKDAVRQALINEGIAEGTNITIEDIIECLSNHDLSVLNRESTIESNGSIVSIQLTTEAYRELMRSIIAIQKEYKKHYESFEDISPDYVLERQRPNPDDDILGHYRRLNIIRLTHGVIYFGSGSESKQINQQAAVKDKVKKLIKLMTQIAPLNQPKKKIIGIFTHHAEIVELLITEYRSVTDNGQLPDFSEYEQETRKDEVKDALLFVAAFEFLRGEATQLEIIAELLHIKDSKELQSKLMSYIHLWGLIPKES